MAGAPVWKTRRDLRHSNGWPWALPPIGRRHSWMRNSAVNELGQGAGLVELLRKYDINAYAASVQVYAVKGR